MFEYLKPAEHIIPGLEEHEIVFSKGMSKDQFLTAKEIAAELRCSTAQAYKLLRGEVVGLKPIPHLPLGRKKVVRRSSFDAWKAANETGILPSDQVNAGAESRTSA